jgi:hypothetical protein
MRKQMRFRQTILVIMMLGALLATVGTARRGAQAHPGGFVFTPLVFLGDPTPGGDTFTNDFESGFINNRGDVIFGADVTADAQEGVFFLRRGLMSQLARAGEPAPGGGVFGPAFGAPVSLNDQGDGAFIFFLDPLSFPLGVNAGVYRASHAKHVVTPVVRPGVTPVPGGGVFAGATFGTSLNNGGVLAFGGIVATDQGVHLPDEPYVGLGAGLYKADKKGHISIVVEPGDPAPGGGVFDWTGAAWINAARDVAFMGHVAGEECRAANFRPQAIVMFCLGSIYVKDAASGNIRSVAHAGDPAPGGGVFRQAISPILNDRGDIVFLGDLTPPPLARGVTGVYLYSKGVTIPVARPGDPMPGGGRFVTASNLIGWQVSVNVPGDVAFNAVLDTDDNADSVPDTGLFVWSRGSTRLVARTGTVIPGVGTIAHLAMEVTVIPPGPGFVPNSGATMNDHGQVVFGATLDDGRGVLLVATPKRH